jgi:hypothetical protein
MPNFKVGADSNYNRNDINYCYHLVAFLDVQGQTGEFANLSGVPTAGDEPAKQVLIEILKRTVGFISGLNNQLRRYLESSSAPTEIRNAVPEGLRAKLEELRRTEVKVTSFSDSLIIFTSLQPRLSASLPIVTVNDIFLALATLMILSPVQEHILRGGLEVDGAVEIFENEIYGPALNRAYFLESQIAKYPRVLVGQGLIEFLDRSALVPGTDPASRIAKDIAIRCRQMIRADFDGQQFLDYLGDYPASVFKKNLKDVMPKALEFIKRQEKFFADRGDIKLAPRYAYLRKYFENRMDAWL